MKILIHAITRADNVLRNGAPRGVLSAKGASGLVTNSTSDTQPVCILDPVEGRKRRLKRAAQCAARCHTTLTTVRVRALMVTLTYAELDAWEPLHLTAFLKAAREYYRRKGAKFRYVWVGELQQRSAVHYHVLVWLPVRMQVIKPDKRGWWPHGMTRVDRRPWNARASTIFGGMISATHGRADMCRVELHYSRFKSWAAGRALRWCADTRT